MGAQLASALYLFWLVSGLEQQRGHLPFPTLALLVVWLPLTWNDSINSSEGTRCHLPASFWQAYLAADRERPLAVPGTLSLTRMHLETLHAQTLMPAHVQVFLPILACTDAHARARAEVFLPILACTDAHARARAEVSLPILACTDAHARTRAEVFLPILVRTPRQHQLARGAQPSTGICVHFNLGREHVMCMHMRPRAL